VIMLSW